MSLINKMLQDLDARGSQSGETMPAEIKSVARGERAVSTPVAAAALVAVCAVAAAGVFGWRYYQQRRVAPAQVAIVVPAAPPAAPVVTVATPPVVMPAPAPIPAMPAPTAELAPPEVNKAPVKLAKIAAKKVAAIPPVLRKAPRHEVWLPAPRAERPAVPAPVVAQRGEGEYRRALASLAEGRVSDAIAGLEQTLRLEPRHDAARQTLIGLLIENRRGDEAMRQLQQALTLDSRQPSLAMLLARLQIERGGTGIDTLLATLPAAAGNAEYHAFLAGALQRAQRNREAAEQFQAALRSKPQQGVWLMGLGIALQADKRSAEAIDAFERAKASGTLSAELQTFVERRLVQLGR